MNRDIRINILSFARKIHVKHLLTKRDIHSIVKIYFNFIETDQYVYYYHFAHLDNMGKFEYLIVHPYLKKHIDIELCTTYILALYRQCQQMITYINYQHSNKLNPKYNILKLLDNFYIIISLKFILSDIKDVNFAGFIMHYENIINIIANRSRTKENEIYDNELLKINNKFKEIKNSMLIDTMLNIPSPPNIFV